MTDAQMDTAYGGQFPNTYPRQGGIGYNAAALSRTGGSCCAANTKARFKIISMKTQIRKEFLEHLWGKSLNPTKGRNTFQGLCL